MSLQNRFQWLDYVLLTIIPAGCLMFGFVYEGRCTTFENFKSTLSLKKKLPVAPLTLSLIISFINGMSLLDTPKEIHFYGLQAIFILGGFCISILSMQYIYLPIFYHHKFTTIFQYLEKRFDSRVKILAMLLFVIQNVLWLPITIHLTASFITQITDMNMQLLSIIFLAIGLFYVSFGGLSAIVWSDAIQALITIALLLAMAIKGSIALTQSEAIVTNRTYPEDYDLNLNPLTIYNWYPLIMEGWIFYMQIFGVDQSVVQKYISLRRDRDAKRSIWLFIFGTFTTGILSYYCSVIIYVKFYNYNPQIELSPLLGEFPGIYGLFAARMLIASLSTIASEMNAIITVIFEDGYLLIFNKTFTSDQSTLKGKLVFFAICIVSVSFIYIIERSGQISVALAVGAIASATSFGLFLSGALFPWIKSKEVLIGATVSIIYLIWLTFDSAIKFSKYFSDSCYNKTDAIPNVNITINCFDSPIYRNSYFWCTAIGGLGTLFTGILACFLLSPSENKEVDLTLIAPFIRKLIKDEDAAEGGYVTSVEFDNGLRKLYLGPNGAPDEDPWLQVLP